MTTPADQRRTELLAYQIWQDEGRPEGRDGEHWRRAEQQLEVEFRIGFPDATGNEDPDSTLSAIDAADGGWAAGDIDVLLVRQPRRGIALGP